MKVYRRVVYFILATAFATVSSFAAVPDRTEVVIIGAGLSGLATAYQLKKLGIPFHILELSTHVGGRVNTVHYKSGGKDVYSDSGMEEYWESNPAVALLKELKLPLRSDEAYSSMVLDKKVEFLGDEGGEVFLERILGAADYKSLNVLEAKMAPMVARLRASSASGDRAPIKDLLALKDQSFADWVKAQGVSERVQNWIRISVECEIGTDWDRISAVDGIAEYHIFLGKGEMSYRVVGGNEKFVDALADTVGRKNLSLNKRVKSIVTRNGETSVYYLDGATNQSGRIRAPYIVSTIPLYRLFEVQFDPSLSDKKRAAINSQAWGAYFKAHIFVKAGTERFWIKGKTSMLPLLSDSELGVVYDGNPDEQGLNRILSLLITGPHAEAFNMMPQDNVRTQILSALEKLFPGIGKTVKGIEFYRYHPRAIAAWPPGRSRYDELSDEIRRPENHVYFAGDFTESSHSDGAFISAKRVVDEIVSARKVALVGKGH